MDSQEYMEAIVGKYVNVTDCGLDRGESINLHELAMNIIEHMKQDEELYQHFADRFRKEHQAVKMVPSTSVEGALDCVARMDIAWVEDTTT